jgi:hypothetical protein
MAIYSIFLLFGIFYGTLVHFVVFWYIFPGFGILYPEKSGNHAPDNRHHFDFHFVKWNFDFNCVQKMEMQEFLFFSEKKNLSELCHITAADTIGPGLPDGLFSNQKNNLGKFWRMLRWKMLVYFMAIWSTL